MSGRDDSEYEKWRRHGRDRGWFEKASDEIKSWFGDEDAELRRSYDDVEGRTDRYRDIENRFPRDREPEGRYDRGRELGGRYGRELYGGSSLRREIPGQRWSEESSYEQTGPGTNFGGSERSRDREHFPHDYGQKGFNSGSGYEDRYIGRGPKSYRRSDERLQDEICEKLTRDARIDATEIDVEVKECEVTLSGTVDTRYEKRLAEDLAEDVFGVTEVHNNIRVSALGRFGQSEQHPGSAQTSMGKAGFGDTTGLGQSGLGEQGPQNRI